MKKEEKSKENRQNKRVRVLSLVKYTILPGASSLVANIRDISLGGLVFLADQEIEPGTVLQLYFLPPNRERPVEARGVVVRYLEVTKKEKEKAFEVGVQFLDVSEEARLAIRGLEAFLANQKKAQH